MPAAASAAERAAARWSATTQQAGRSSEEFSRRVRKTIADLEFERQQLTRNAAEQARYAAVRRAGVAASSQEGQAIMMAVRRLQEQKDALGQSTVVARAYQTVWAEIKGILAAVTFAAVTAKIIEFTKGAFEAAAGMDELAEQVGLTAKTLQALQFQATQNGVKLEQLDTGLSKFSQKMGEAADGSKEMVEALAKLGVKNIDVQGKLRPTEDLLVDVAKAITSIDDPARRSAAAVDFFGKAGTRMLPLLTQIAGGLDTMGLAAAKSGAMIEAETITKLDKLADKMDANKLVMRAWTANALATLDDWRVGFNTWALDVVHSVETAFKDLVSSADQWLTPIGDKIGQVGASAGAMFIAAFEELPGALGRLFTNAWEAAQVATNKGINSITAIISDSNFGKFLGLGRTNLDEGATGAGSVLGGVGERINAAGQAAAAAMATRQQEARDAAALAASTGAAGGIQGRGAARGTFGTPGAPTTGAATSAVKASGGAAEDAEKKYAKLITQLDLAVTAQDKMTAAAGRGEQAYERQKVHLEAQQKALDIYGKALDDNDPRLQKLEERMLKIAQGKVAEAFANATTELQNQNVILEAQIRLMNEAPEIQARELALIKAKTEAEKAGTAVTQEAIDARRQAIEQNERLKTQQEELKRAQELWTAPLKSALESIQQTAADAFEKMLEGGKFSFEELGAVFKKTIMRMAAEFLALATIRPVMSVIVNAVGGGGSAGGGGGILGGLMGGGGSGGGAGGILQSIGGTVLQSQGGIGGIFKNIGGLFGIGGGAAAGSAIGTAGGASSLGGALAGGVGASSAGIGGGLSAAFAAIPVAGWIAAAAAIAKGILGPGDKQRDIKSSLSTLLGPSPEEWMANPKRSAFDVLGPGGPVGAAVLKLFGLHPFMEETPIVMNQEYGQLSFGSGPGGGFGTSGGAWGPEAQAGNLQNPLNAMGQTMQSILDAMGGVKDASKVWGVAMESFSRVHGEWNFQNKTSFLVGPDGQKRQWGMGSSGGDIGMEQAGVAALLESILGGAVGDITKNMRKALEGLNLTGKETFETVGNVVGEIMAFDEVIKNFGKTTTTAEQALKAIDEQMAALYTTADKYGLDKGQLDVEKNKQRFNVALDFANSLSRALMPAGEAAMLDIAAERTALYEENAAFIAAKLPGYLDQAANIEEIYQRKRLAIMAEGNAEALAAQKLAMLQLVDAVGASVSSLQDLIRSLSPGGGLSNTDPAGMLAGLRANYTSSYAQAAADPTNSAAVQRTIQAAQEFAQFSQSFYGGSAAFNRDRDMVLNQAMSLQSAIAGGGVSGSSGQVAAILQQLLAATNKSNDNSAERDATIQAVMGLLQRYLANPEAA